VELHQLKAFLAVRDTGSATAAAARLGVRQSTVSYAVRTLEDELGTELFHRVGRGMSPTPAGHALVGPARRVVRDCSQAAETVAPVGAHGRLELAALSTVVAGPFAQRVAAWLDGAHGRSVRVHDVAREEDAVDLLLGGTVEVVCTRLPLPVPPEADLTVMEIGRWEWQVAFPPGWPSVPDGALTVGDMSSIPMVLVGAGGRSELERATHRTRLHTAAVAEQREARTSMMLAGIGATIVSPTVATDAESAGSAVRRMAPTFEQSVGLLFHEATLSPLARSFVRVAGARDERSAGGRDRS
jgi:DNA-binding transcriptional LysR family regulator